MDAVKAHWQRGTAASAAGDPAGAAACFRAALAALPADDRSAPSARSALLCNLSAACLASGDADSAIEAGRGAVAAARAAGGTKGRAAKPLYRLGTALRAVGAHAAAVAALSAAVKEAGDGGEGAVVGPVEAELAKATAASAARRRALNERRTAAKQRRESAPADGVAVTDASVAGAREALGLARDGGAPDRRALRLAYLRSAAVAHPDRGGTDAAFRRVRAAYELLRAARVGGVVGEAADSGTPPPPPTTTLAPPAEPEAAYRTRQAAAAAEAEAAAAEAADAAAAAAALTVALRAWRAAGGRDGVRRVTSAREEALKRAGDAAAGGPAAGVV